jgi:hypothetical protein
MGQCSYRGMASSSIIIITKACHQQEDDLAAPSISQVVAHPKPPAAEKLDDGPLTLSHSFS